MQNDGANIALIKNFIVENKIVLLIIDSLSRFWGIQNENDNAEVVRELSPAFRHRPPDQRNRHAHPPRTKDRRRGRTTIRGGGSLFGIVDQAILLERPVGEPSNKRVLKTIGRYDSLQLVIELVEDEIRTIGTVEECSDAGALKKCAPL